MDTRETLLERVRRPRIGTSVYPLQGPKDRLVQGEIAKNPAICPNCEKPRNADDYEAKFCKDCLCPCGKEAKLQDQEFGVECMRFTRLD